MPDEVLGTTQAPPVLRLTFTVSKVEKERWHLFEGPADEFIVRLKAKGHTPGEKDGAGIIGARFAAGSRLLKRNVLEVTAIILDVDGRVHKVEGGEPVYEVVPPEDFLAKLPFRWVAHTSYNHTPERPKYRVILPLARPVSPRDFVRLWWWVYELTGRKSDPSCKNPDRMYYAPRCKPGYEALHWFQEGDGPWLRLEDVPADYVPPEPLPEEDTTWREKQTTKGDYNPLTPEQVRLLLQGIEAHPLVQWAMENPALVRREVWRGIATNIAAAVLDAPETYDDGEQLFHRISEPDESRYNYSVTHRTFRDALRSAAQYGPMRMSTMQKEGAPEALTPADGPASLVAAVRKASWRTLVRAQHPASQGGDDAPFDRGSRSPKTPTLAGAEDADVPDGVRHAPPPGGVKYVAVDVNSEDSTGSIADHGPSEFLYDMSADRYLMVDGQGYWQLDAPFKLSALQHLLAHWGLDKKNQAPYISRIKAFHTKKAIFTTPEVLLNDGMRTLFNTYQPPWLEPHPGNWDDIRAVFLNLVGNDPAALEYFLDWNALPVQSLRAWRGPLKMRTSVVLHGEPGAGKGLFERIMDAVYGSTNTTVIGQSALESRFSGELVDKVFVICNEVITSNNRTQETANKLKTWVTDDTFPLEAKYKDAQRANNYFNIVFCSNDDRPVLIEKGDRRYSVFHSSVLPKEIGERVAADLDGNRVQLQAFLHHLLTRQVKVKPGELFHTEARQQLLEQGKTSDEKFVSRIVEDGWVSVAYSWVEAGSPNQLPREMTFLDVYVRTDTLYEVYRFWCHREGLLPRSQVALGRTMGRYFPQARTVSRWDGPRKQRCWEGLPIKAPDAVVEEKKNDAPPAKETDNVP